MVGIVIQWFMDLIDRLDVSGMRADGVAMIPLNALQLAEREIYLGRLRSGGYVRHRFSHCPACSCERAFLIAEKERYGLPQRTGVCHDCGLVFTLDPLDEESSVWFYRDQYRKLYEGTVSDGILRKQEMDRLFEERNFLEALAKDVPGIRDLGENSLVVEIGAGAGWNLQAFHQRGIPVLGCDPDPVLVEEGIRRGICMQPGSAEDLLKQRVRADWVLLNHVLEHVIDPRAFLQVVRGILKPGGHLFVGVPGLRALFWGEWGADLPHALQNAHVFLFELETLSRFTMSAGFKSVVSHELIWSVFQEGEEVNPPKRGLRGDTVVRRLQAARWTGPLWTTTSRILGAESGCFRMAQRAARFFATRC